jgi:hypothetical protein
MKGDGSADTPLSMTHRIVLIVCFFCSTIGTGFAATNGPVELDFAPFGAEHPSDAIADCAPADVSFGQYPMSVTGIENAIHRYDGTARLDDGPIAYAIVAIRDWERRYPRDPWIPRELFAMQRVYEHARTDEGRAYAERVATWVETDYPTTGFAERSRADLGRSFSEPEAGAKN